MHAQLLNDHLLPHKFHEARSCSLDQLAQNFLVSPVKLGDFAAEDFTSIG